MRRRAIGAAVLAALCSLVQLGSQRTDLMPRAYAASGAAPAVRNSPASGPQLTIVGVRILHLVRGKEVVTRHLLTGEYAEFLVQYSAVGAPHVRAILDITKNGKVLGSVLLQPVTYAGHPSFGWIFGFTRDAGFGTFYAHFHLSAAGGLSANRERKFSVTLH